ncbi:uncharacterized protein LOC121549770 [Coregonus clupeaformis]|uniref:uncharacterized protein LOC121549770 n=1 Tax=Coregonus clupeaformis TaxID=59861 RepID=UPI001E1C66A8|nr:uncharacterized protein LOC121549770 [Coregonus clupeaformis]
MEAVQSEKKVEERQRVYLGLQSTTLVSYGRQLGENDRVTRRFLDSILLKVGPSKITIFMVEVSAIVKARPLVPVSTDPDLPLILMTATLLSQKVGVVPPPQGEFNENNLFSRQWRQVQSLPNTFWHRWKKEYLPILQNSRKWQKEMPNLREGDIVMLRDSQVKKNDWPMGIIVKTFPGSDGKVRKVEVKTTKDGSCKTFLRPVSETVLLLSPKTNK